MRSHAGQPVPRSDLQKIAGSIDSWPRVLRTARDDGYDLVYDRKTNSYCFTNKDPVKPPKDTRYISKKIRAMVLARDNGTCQMCGKTISGDGIKLHIDHIIPLEWGGKTEIDNLQALCRECNEGKKAFVSGENRELMEKISNATNTKERLRLYFEYYYNIPIEVGKLSVIAKTRAWERQVRYLRKDYNMDIEYLAANKQKQRERASYVYWKLAEHIFRDLSAEKEML